jgi:hypothetical protein
MKDKDCKPTLGRYTSTKEFMDTSGISPETQALVENAVFCSQCGELVSHEKISMQFNAGHGVVTVCLKCKPTGTAEEIFRDLNDFMGMADETLGAD